ncbi:MAG: EAL domain-containing protein [Nitrospirota bacterium]|nr:EAL domain-containing protein [Nitrospirota bacterium]
MKPEYPRYDSSSAATPNPDEELRLLIDISRAVMEADSFASGITAALRGICEHTGWLMGEAWLPRCDGACLEWSPAFYAANEKAEAFIQKSDKYNFRPGIGLPGRAWSSKQAVWIRDVTADSDFLRALLASTYGLKAAVAVPVLAGQEVVAVIDFMTGKVIEERDEHLITLITAVAAQLGTFIKHLRTEEQLRKSEAGLANAQRIAKLGNWEWDIASDELSWSDETYRIFGLDRNGFKATYEAFLKSVHPEDRDFVRRSLLKAIREKTVCSMDYRVVLPDGRERIVHEEAEVLLDGAGVPLRMCGTVQNVTKSILAQRELKKLSEAIQQSVNTVFITDNYGKIEYVNPEFERVTGYSGDEAIGRNPRILASGETAPREYQLLWKTITQGKTWRGVLKNRKKDGTFYWASGVISPIRDEKGNVTHFLAVQEDITEKKQTEEKVQYLLTFDETTGLVNRARFMALLNDWFESSGEKRSGVLLLIDIDDFRIVNDIYGHRAGDEMLRRIANLLQGIIPNPQIYSGEGDLGRGTMVGRMGGDEFAVFLSFPYTREGLDLLIQRVRIELERLRYADLSHSLTASIGAAFYPEHGGTTRELVMHADVALVNARKAGGDRCIIYSADDRQLEKTHSRLKEKERIQKAIAGNRFEPWFQPILDLRDNRIHHFEALARMYNADGTLVMPYEFIDTAEKFGLVNAIDRAITKKTMARQALNGNGEKISFGMNLSGKNLGDTEFLAFLRNAIEETGADPGSLIFEITETAAVHDLDKAIKFLGELRQLGCRFALDDFGVGFNSFLYLRELTVDYIKIDGSFIRKVHENANDRLFVKAIVEVARGLGIKTIAEFVENGEILELVRSLGVDYAQGYAIGKPAKELVLEMQ